MNNFAALYMRLSKDDGKSESRSISSQREILRNFASEKGFLIFDEYIDKYKKIKQESTGGKRQIAKLFLNNFFIKYLL